MTDEVVEILTAEYGLQPIGRPATDLETMLGEAPAAAD